MDNDYKSIVIFDYELPRYQFVFNVFESWPLNTEHLYFLLHVFGCPLYLL